MVTPSYTSDSHVKTNPIRSFGSIPVGHQRRFPMAIKKNRQLVLCMAVFGWALGPIASKYLCLISARGQLR